METKAEQDHRLFDKYAVHDVSTVKDFLDKYYRTERYAGCGEVYAQGFLKSYQKEYTDEGIVWISKHDSITGKVVSFIG